MDDNRVGTDLVEVDRIKEIVQRHSALINKIYRREEIEYCSSKRNKYQHYAARFAAKEALFKAVGTAWGYSQQLAQCVG